MEQGQRLHPIQEKILKRLGYGDRKNFSEIRGDIESNKFAFHLKKLRERRLIEKSDEGYRTTREGREILPYFDLKNSRHPVIVADLLVFSGNEVYLLPKKDDPLDPFEGDYRAPSTRIGKNDRVEESAEKIFEEEFGRAKEVEKTAVFDSEVEFRDGSRQHYILFFFKTEVDEDLEERGYRIDQLGSIELLPGLEKVIRKAKWSDSFFMGEWDIEETESGFSVRKQDF
jgi:ADP-ribose pyrophosphatase YjhB (NUDIX family)